jgi:hypothetical protein
MSSEAPVTAKKRGPKPKGILKVVYYRRVLPEMVVALDAILAGNDAPPPVVEAAPRRDTELATLNAQNYALAGEADALRVRVSELEQDAAALTAGVTDVAVVALRARLAKAEARVKELESTYCS